LAASATGSAVQSGTTGCDVLPPIPSPPSSASVFHKESGNDDTADIQGAINALKQGDWLVFPPGTYTISKHLIVPVNGVTLYGKGATIHATNPTDGALLIEGDNVSVYDFTTDQDSTGRQGMPWAGGISVFDNRTPIRRQVQNVVIRGNTINNAAGVGIFLYKANGFTVAGNTIYRSWADGIHLTGGTTNGRVIDNSVSENGDDMVAIVSYAGARNAPNVAERYKNWMPDQLANNIYVAQNRLNDTYWGRGVSVVGGSDVTIENNVISRTPTAAGIYLLKESFYTTFGDHNILVRNNDISEVQTMPPTYKPAVVGTKYTRHGAIEISSQMTAEEQADPRYSSALSVSNIEITGNRIHDARFAGIRAGANSGVAGSLSDVLISGNAIDHVGVDAIADVYEGASRASLVCIDNDLNGQSWGSNCDRKAPPASHTISVTGAALVCSADGSVRSGQRRPGVPQSVSAAP
jgi:parallel beta-helix repeat protein